VNGDLSGFPFSLHVSRHSISGGNQLAVTCGLRKVWSMWGPYAGASG